MTNLAKGMTYVQKFDLDNVIKNAEISVVLR